MKSLTFVFCSYSYHLQNLRNHFDLLNSRTLGQVTKQIHDFSIIHILREINFLYSRSAKYATFGGSEF